MEIKGAEGIVIHNGNIVLGMQKSKRWYKIEKGQTSAIIKTLGGSIEEQDQKSSKKALIRELLEEVNGIEEQDIKVSESPIFNKQIKMSDLNPYEEKLNISMNADFYLLEIFDKKDLMPNDLPALIEMPMEKFLKLEFVKEEKLRNINEYVIKNEKIKFDLPEKYVLMIPEEVRIYLINSFE